MKKFSFLALLSSLFANQLLSQSIPNNSFETWTIQNQTEVATSWVKAPSVTKSTDAYSGEFVAKVVAGDFTNPQSGQTFPIPGRLVTGVSTQGMGQTAIEGFAFSMRPDSLVGWYKYLPVQTDQCVFNVTFTKWNTTSQSRDVIGQGQFVDNSEPNYNRFSFPINYQSNTIPDTCVIEFLSSDVQSGIQGSELFIDAIDFVFDNVGINENIQMKSYTLYPNPITENGIFTLSNATDNIQEVELLSIDGTLISKLNGTNKQYTIPIIQSGIYMLKITSKDDFELLRIIIL